MANLFTKLKGDRAALPPSFSTKAVLLAWLGGFIAIAAVALSTLQFSHMLILGSFGASCVILFAYPDAPFAQPRNTIGGHFLSSLVGLLWHLLVGGCRSSRHGNRRDDAHQNRAPTCWL